MSVTLSGTVEIELAANSNPVFTITITAATPQGTTLGSTQIPASAASPGSYEMKNLEPGQTYITFQGDQLVEQTQIALLSGNASNVVNVSMEYSFEASLSGICTDSSTGNPLESVSITIFNLSTNHEYKTTSDSSGAYSIASVPVGTYNVEVEPPDGYEDKDMDDLSLLAGNTVVDFNLSPGENYDTDTSSGPAKVRITGTVVSDGMTTTSNGVKDDTDGSTTVAGATVTVTNTDTGAVLGTTTSDSNGNFSIEVPVENMTVTATKDGTQYATENVNEEAVDGSAVIVIGSG